MCCVEVLSLAAVVGGVASFLAEMSPIFTFLVTNSANLISLDSVKQCCATMLCNGDAKYSNSS